MIKKFESGDKSQLSPHFNVQEFKCKCGKEHEILLSTELVDKLEKLYSALNCSKIIVTSGYRCTTHDRNVGGNGTGQHTKGNAADICCYGQDGQSISSKTVCCKAQDIGFGGIANIDTSYQYTHVDVRSNSKWYGDETKGNSTVTSHFYSYFGISKTNEPLMKGIDVSVHNGNIDWQKVKMPESNLPFSVQDMGVNSRRKTRDLRRITEMQRQ